MLTEKYARIIEDLVEVQSMLPCSMPMEIRVNVLQAVLDDHLQGKKDSPTIDLDAPCPGAIPSDYLDIPDYPNWSASEFSVLGGK